MKKLLHERLREHEGLGKPFEGYGDGGYAIDSRAAKQLADEIERYYIPRPRFEDGEPIQFGDEATYGFPSLSNQNFKVERMNFYKDGSFTLCECGGNGHNYQSGELVKRPSPKVLDADGVEIKVGDTVWSMYFPNDKRTVDHITDDGKVWFEDGHWAWDIKVTHKDPDSLEKLWDEMRHGRETSLLSFANRFLAIMERIN